MFETDNLAASADAKTHPEKKQQDQTVQVQHQAENVQKLRCRHVFFALRHRAAPPCGDRGTPLFSARSLRTLPARLLFLLDRSFRRQGRRG